MSQGTILPNEGQDQDREAIRDNHEDLTRLVNEVFNPFEFLPEGFKADEASVNDIVRIAESSDNPYEALIAHVSRLVVTWRNTTTASLKALWITKQYLVQGYVKADSHANRETVSWDSFLDDALGPNPAISKRAIDMHLARFEANGFVKPEKLTEPKEPQPEEPTETPAEETQGTPSTRVPLRPGSPRRIQFPVNRSTTRTRSSRLTPNRT